MFRDGQVYYDISPEISEKLAVFPGDAPFVRRVTVDFGPDSNYLASSIHGTVHLGAHTDAPNHYSRVGEGISARALDFYLGDCQVISVKLARGERVLPSHVALKSVTAKRVLFKTGSFPDPNRWNGDFNSLSPELVAALAERGVILVGIDTPSIDPAADAKLESHQVVAARNMAILEGIVLDHVPEGLYSLIALPLKIRDADASPVRAVLIREGSP